MFRCDACQSDFDGADEVEVEAAELEVLEALDVLELVEPFEPLSVDDALASDDLAAASPSPLARPFVEADDERESVTYQPLPLKTMPTG